MGNTSKQLAEFFDGENSRMDLRFQDATLMFFGIFGLSEMGFSFKPFDLDG